MKYLLILFFLCPLFSKDKTTDEEILAFLDSTAVGIGGAITFNAIIIDGFRIISPEQKDTLITNSNYSEEGLEETFKVKSNPKFLSVKKN